MCKCSQLDWSQVDQTAVHHPDCEGDATVVSDNKPDGLAVSKIAEDMIQTLNRPTIDWLNQPPLVPPIGFGMPNLAGSFIVEPSCGWPAINVPSVFSIPNEYLQSQVSCFAASNGKVRLADKNDKDFAVRLSSITMIVESKRSDEDGFLADLILTNGQLVETGEDFESLLEWWLEGD